MKKITYLFLVTLLVLGQKAVAQIPSVLTDDDFSTRTGTFTDTRDGKTYAYKQYGETDWFMQNLNWAGDDSSIGTTGPDPQNENGVIYGRYYNRTNDDISALCPEGWTVPNMNDWANLVEHLSTTYDDPDLRKNNDNLWLFWKAAYYLRGGSVGEDGLWTYGTKAPQADEIQFNLLPSGWLDSSGEGFQEDQNKFIGESTLIYTLSKTDDKELYWTGTKDSGNDGHENLRHSGTDPYGNIRCVRPSDPSNMQTSQATRAIVYPSLVDLGQPIYINTEKDGATVNVYTTSGKKLLQKTFTGDSYQLFIKEKGLFLIDVETVSGSKHIKVTVK